MPTSETRYDGDLRAWVLDTFEDHSISILDVGAGAGKHRDLLVEYDEVYAVEVWEPYVDRYQLMDRYRDVFVGDVRDMQGRDLRHFDLVILGDVLEHLHVADAQRLLGELDFDEQTVIIAVPFQYEQGEVEGNPFERHIQDDLTHLNFIERYGGLLPNLSTLARDNEYAVYLAGAALEGVAGQIDDTPEENIEIPVEWLQQQYVVIMTPAYGGNLSIEYFRSAIKTQEEFKRLGIRMAFITIEGASHIDRARNFLVASAMAIKESTHLLFIDADQGWEPNAILKLMAHDREVIGVPVRKKTNNFQFAMNFLDTNHSLAFDRGVLEVKEIGTGFMMLRRDAIERLHKEYPERKLTRFEENARIAPYHYVLFDACQVDGTYISEDLAFCRLWREIGGKIYAEPTSSIVHVGRIQYSGSLQSVLRKEG